MTTCFSRDEMKPSAIEQCPLFKFAYLTAQSLIGNEIDVKISIYYS